jgi:hypothetical protein
MEESRSRSLIGSEYFAKLMPGSVGYAVLARLFSNARVIAVSLSVAPQMRRKVRELVATPRDRTFVIAAHNSDERKLVSHDYKDFPPPRRRDINRALDVEIIDAGTGYSRL